MVQHVDPDPGRNILCVNVSLFRPPALGTASQGGAVQVRLPPAVFPKMNNDEIIKTAGGSHGKATTHTQDVNHPSRRRHSTPQRDDKTREDVVPQTYRTSPQHYFWPNYRTKWGRRTMAREPDVVHRLPRQRTAHGTIDRAAAHYCRGWCHALESRGRGRRQTPACPRRISTTPPPPSRGTSRVDRGPSHQPLGVGWGPQGGCSRNTSGRPDTASKEEKHVRPHAEDEDTPCSKQ